MKYMLSILILCLLLFSSNIIAQGMTIDSNGNVVIGAASSVDGLSVNGIIQSASDGIKFPDGSVQVTASVGGGSGGGSYVKVAIVAQGGGDYTDPLTAMNNLATWCGIPSVSNPCLLKIMPGIYDVGTNILQMQEYVDIEGSGESVTKITGNTGGLTAVVMGADNAEIRFITVEHTGGGTYAFAIYDYDTSSKITNVTAITSGATENVSVLCEYYCKAVITNVNAIATGGSLSMGFYIADRSSPEITNVRVTASDGIENIGVDFNDNASSTMNNVTVSASGGTKSRGFKINGASNPIMNSLTVIALGASNENYGIWNIQASSPEINNLTINASGGAYNYGVYNRNYSGSGGTIKIDHSVIKGTTNAIYTHTTYTTLIGSTRIEGSVTGPGTNICASVYDENYTFYSGPNCP